MGIAVLSTTNANSEGSIMKFLPGICATALAATFALPVSSPVNAAPVFVPQAQAVQSQVIQVKDGDARWRRSYGWHDDDWWVPAGAFLAGALIGGAIANSRRSYYDYDGRYYGRRYYVSPYYGDRYYGERYYRDRYYVGDRYYRSYANGRPCSPRLDDAGKCRSYGSRYYGGYGRRVVVVER
jgi:hypothetical protein